MVQFTDIFEDATFDTIHGKVTIIRIIDHWVIHQLTYHTPIVCSKYDFLIKAAKWGRELRIHNKINNKNSETNIEKVITELQRASKAYQLSLIYDKCPMPGRPGYLKEHNIDEYSGETAETIADAMVFIISKLNTK